MHLFLTGVLPFLAHDHASAVAFLTCRYHNFHSSIIPEFLSDEERVESFCGARQQNQLEADKATQYCNLYNLFVQTPLMQFSPSLIVSQKDCAKSIIKPLLKTKYFSRTLQRCTFGLEVEVTDDLLQGLSKVQSLTKLDLGISVLENEHLEIIVNSFPTLETCTMQSADRLDPSNSIRISSPPPPTTKTLRSLTMRNVDPTFATQFIANFPNLRKLVLFGQSSSQPLDLLPLSSSLPILTDLSLAYITLQNTESLKNLVHLTFLSLSFCRMSDSLTFLTQENSLPELATFSLAYCEQLSTSSLASLDHAPNLHVLEVISQQFDDSCLQYLYNIVHLRKLDLSESKITGGSELFELLMQKLFQLEELILYGCRIGGQGAIAGSLYRTHSRLRVLDFFNCNLVDDDLNGIDALKNTLEVLDVGSNGDLTNDALIHCKDLVKLKILKLEGTRINNLFSFKDCVNLEELDVSFCDELTDDSFKAFSEEPNSFPNLRILNLSSCDKLTWKVFEHLSKNNNLVYKLKEVNVKGMFNILSSSDTARKNICQLKGLSRIHGILPDDYGNPWNEEIELMGELLRRSKNLEEVR